MKTASFYIFRSARPPFLLLAPACVALGAATALAVTHDISLLHLLWIFIGALSAQLSMHWLNEYYDFKSGLDQATLKTPFSGGSGALVEKPELALWVLTLGLIALVVAITIGFYFVFESGFSILLIGILGVLLIIGYTEWINRMPRFCLIAPGLGFGILIVLGTHLALAKELSWAAISVAMMTFFWINNLLLVNQLPDIDADTQVGRRHFSIAYGMEKTQRVYLVFALLAYCILIAAVSCHVLPLLALVTLITVPLVIITYKGIGLYGKHIADHHAAMVANVLIATLSPWILAIVLLITY